MTVKYDLDQVTRDPEALIRHVLAVRTKAYAPYSQFPVGAILIGANGECYEGVNVENASFGLTNCAERTAVFSAVAAGCSDWSLMALATAGGHMPCGACRQVLVEFNRELPIWIVDADSERIVSEVVVSELLPGRFELPS